ncbi:MAG: MOSC domain-containing protein [Acidobacteria bacterium]|nr:MOSC domain-containing protein [Acidobacteriota bacterium]
MADRSVGTVRELRRYPVKSMAAESLQSVAVSWHGLAGDRRWAFVRPDMERSGFPWLTIREKPDLWLHEPRFLDPADVEASKTVVKTPAGVELEVADPELARSLGDGVRVIKQYGGVFDTFPLSLLTVQSVEGLSALAGEALTPLRFRPNLVIDAAGAEPFPEDHWVGAVLRIGSLRFRVDVRDQRCVMVNVDPAGAAPNPAVLRSIARERDARFGVYGTIVQPGEVSVGDPVVIES